MKYLIICLSLLVFSCPTFAKTTSKKKLKIKKINDAKMQAHQNEMNARREKMNQYRKSLKKEPQNNSLTDEVEPTSSN